MGTVGVANFQLLSELREARLESDRLFQIIKPASLYERPIDARHRVIFYVGHLDGFDSIQICREGLGIQSPDTALDTLFQAGIDPDSSSLPTDTVTDWPSPTEVDAYVSRCRAHVNRHLEQAPEEIIYMALEHRLMHLETLAYMFHNFDYAWKFTPVPPVRLAKKGQSGGFENDWCQVPAGPAALGKTPDDCFGWDNEFEQHVVDVSGFELQKYPVTNGAYLSFVEQTGAALPQFWAWRGNILVQRGMLQEFPLPLDWPVYVSLDQAKAYAAWSGCQIVTEAQFHRAAYGSSSRKMRPFPWGTAQPSPSYGNFDFQSWDPHPVDAHPLGASSFGVEQLVGNGWEWTETPFRPFPGFAARPSYPGYSANFFDDEHFVMKGGSSRTAARLLRASFRNWFRHDYPYMYAKFRCVRNS